MKPGAVIIASHIEQIISRDTRFEYSAGKKDNLVFIFLGTEPKDGSNNLDPIKSLNDLGWKLKPEFKGAFKEKENG